MENYLFYVQKIKMTKHDLLTELTNNNMSDKIFPIGLYVNPPNEKAPDFVK
jgi:hypothetical protein